MTRPCAGSHGSRPLGDSPERGSGSLSVVGMVCALLIVGITCAGLIGVLAANHRAAQAADLAALAAADAARGLTSGDPCDRAQEVAQANRVNLVACALPPGLAGTADIRTSVDIAGPFAFLGPAQGISRAGPPGLSGS
ncbi:Rv3654c family TadE-like protein [Rothia sp. P5766]|uniref:Rv3654c family TadE-like protein n=1 Tax=unclassified Rothia (in: high G+C Gram-positive bacteria) TaxID=2689056 RepID=UPI003AD74718